MGPGRWHIEEQERGAHDASFTSGIFYRRAAQLCRADGYPGFVVTSGDVIREAQGDSKFVAYHNSYTGLTTGHERHGASSFIGSGDVQCTQDGQKSATAP